MISIIIPVLNEAQIIERLLNHLAISSSEKNITEIIVVDGGSIDGTKEIVSLFSEKSDIKVLLLTSEKGRAKQMNLGAKNATGGVLYFLHADTLPPENFDFSILSQIQCGNVAGCFRMKFDGNHPILRISQWFTQFNKKFCRGGDQSLFIKAEIFSDLNGFDENYIVYEDCEFINRIYDNHNFTVINDHVLTSSRRYAQNGTWKLQYHFAIIHLKKILGASPEKLYNYYRDNIMS